VQSSTPDNLQSDSSGPGDSTNLAENAAQRSPPPPHFPSPREK
jgi:hypothetical protein